MSGETDPSNYGVDPVEHANQAFAISTFNGLVALLYALVKRGLLDERSLNAIHSGMSKPLGLGDPDGDNVLLAQTQAKVDEMLADLVLLIGQLKQ